MQFGQVAKLYEVAGDLEVIRHEVAAGLFADFSHAVTDVVIAAGDDVADDEAWSTLLRYLKKLRFVLSSTPLWLAHPSRHHCVGTLAERERLIRDAELTRPAAMPALQRVFAYADQMHNEGSSELRAAGGEVMAELSTNSVAFLIKSPRYRPCVEGTLRSECGHRKINLPITVLAPSQLRTAGPYDVLIVFGPTMWYPPHLLGSPRAQTVHVLAHDWIRDSEPPRMRFGGAGGHDVAPRRRDRSQRRVGAGARSAAVSVEGSDLLPSIDIRRLRELSSSGSQSEADPVVEARVFVLEGQKGVFLGSDDGSSRFTIELEGRDASVRRVPVSQIEEGTFLVLRTEGSGDYVRTMADRILAGRAATLRSAQERWKQPLRSMIRRCGSKRQASRVLSALDVPQATPGNLARWASPENICTQDKTTFVALTRALEVEYDPEVMWHQMHEIRAAHTAAGAAIKNQLLERIQEADLGELRADGVMTFTLEAGVGGTLTAFRVNQVGTETWEVDSSQLGQPFDLDA
jgi:hypothetical protein